MDLSTDSMSSPYAGGLTDSSPEPVQESPPPQSGQDNEKKIVLKGDKGEKLRLASNFLQLTIEKGRAIYEYSVKITPQMDSKPERVRCIRSHQLKPLLGPIVDYDGGSRVHLPFKLDAPVSTTTYEHRRTEELHEVAVKFQRVKRLGDKDCIPLYNTIFRRIMHTLKMVPMQRKFYQPGEATVVTEHKLEVWPGLVTSVDEYEGGLQLLCDVSHRVVRNSTALDVLMDSRSRPEDIKKAMVGQVVLTRYNKKTYTIGDVNLNLSPMDSFQKADGSRVTYKEYYKQQYDLDIQDTAQPLLATVPSKNAAPDSFVNLVPSLCHMTGLTQNMRDDFSVMKIINNVTRTNPKQRQMAVTHFAKSVLNNEEAHKHLKDWGLNLSPVTVELQGRRLPHETISFGNQHKVVVHNGDFAVAAKTSVLLRPVMVKTWAIIYHMKNKREADMLAKWLCQIGQKMGMEVMLPDFYPLNSERTTDFVDAIRRTVTSQTQLTVTILPSKRDDRYSAIKRLCYSERPHANQVIMAKTMQRRNAYDIVSNIAMQINCKLGGELWACKGPYKNCMVVGIDVWHDSDKRAGSVAGMVFSMNQTFSRWQSRAFRQIAHTELVDSLNKTFVEALEKYQQENGKLPDKVIVYRDGVGDGRLDYCKLHEVGQIKSAFQSFDDYSPCLTVIIVSKRINTRFMTFNQTGDYTNPLPGTVVDHTIVKRDYFNFFLVSQKAGQGTVAPTHFLVIHNESDMTADHVQIFSYKLTHMYYNWPGTVRVPAPCLYADKLAMMVGKHIKTTPSKTLSDKLYYL